MDIPPQVIAAQRAADEAWQAVEDYRKAVDADRRSTAEPPTERYRSPVLRPWTVEESARYRELHAAAVAASEARAAAMLDEGIVSTFDTEKDIRAAARGE